MKSLSFVFLSLFLFSFSFSSALSQSVTSQTAASEPVNLSYQGDGIEAHYYEFDLSDASIDYSLNFADSSEPDFRFFDVEDREFNAKDKLLFVVNPYESLELRLVISDIAYPETGSCAVDDFDCSSEEGQNSLEDFYAKVLNFGSSDVVVSSILKGFQDIFIETSGLESIYYNEVLTDDTQENFTDVFEWFLAIYETEFYSLSNRPDTLNSVYPAGFEISPIETQGGVVEGSFLGENYIDSFPDGRLALTSVGPAGESNGGISVSSFGFAQSIEFPYVDIRDLGPLNYIGTAKDFPCVDLDGDGEGWIEELAESCTSEVQTVEPTLPEAHECIDTDKDGWGWIKATQNSCKVENPEEIIYTDEDFECIDTDGDGWGWIEASQTSCKIE